MKKGETMPFWLKEKISKAQKGRLVSLEKRKKISDTLKGRKTGPISEYRRQKISESKMGKPSGMKGKTQSIEARLAIGRANKGRIQPPKSKELREKVSKQMSGHFYTLGRVVSQETRDKISEKMKGRVSPNKGNTYRHSENSKENMSRGQILRILKHPESVHLKYKNCNRGIHCSPKAGSIRWMSSFEKKFYEILDKDQTVSSYKKGRQIPYIYQGKEHLYFPDLEVIYTSGEWEVIEVKPSDLLNDSLVKAKADAAHILYGDRYKFITEKELFDVEDS